MIRAAVLFAAGVALLWLSIVVLIHAGDHGLEGE